MFGPRFLPYDWHLYFAPWAIRTPGNLG